MKTLLRGVVDSFTAPGLIIIGLLIGGTALFAWFLFAIEAAHAEDMPIRAVTAMQHEACMNMPRGSQEMEDGRQQCFEQLYAHRRVKISR